MIARRTTLKTAWYCDACGQRYELVFDPSYADGVEVTLLPGERTVKTLDLLVLRPQDKPVYFVVEGSRLEGMADPEGYNEEDGKRFMYEEHSCPINWLRPEVIYHDGDADPHGIIKFVATRDASTFPADEPVGPNDRDDELTRFIEENTK